MMICIRKILAASASLLAFAVLPAPASAQSEDYEQIVTIMRACAQIDDIAARVTCYDNNIQPRGSVLSAAPAAPAGIVPSTPAPAASVNRPTGFGSEMVPETHRAQREQREEEFVARVGEVKELEPGIFLVTLSDGAQWRFIEAAPMSFDPPRAGSTIELERGSLGSVFLSYAGQRRLRVRRVQ